MAVNLNKGPDDTIEIALPQASTHARDNEKKFSLFFPSAFVLLTISIITYLAIAKVQPWLALHISNACVGSYTSSVTRTFCNKQAEFPTYLLVAALVACLLAWFVWLTSIFVGLNNPNRAQDSDFKHEGPLTVAIIATIAFAVCFAWNILEVIT